MLTFERRDARKGVDERDARRTAERPLPTT